MKPDLEAYLWERIRNLGDGKEIPWPRQVISGMVNDGMIANAKQAWRTLEKWCNKGIYEFGTTLDMGWRTPVLRPDCEGTRVEPKAVKE